VSAPPAAIAWYTAMERPWRSWRETSCAASFRSKPTKFEPSRAPSITGGRTAWPWHKILVAIGVFVEFPL
jgi:hypothetical protein